MFLFVIYLCLIPMDITCFIQYFIVEHKINAVFRGGN